MHGLDAVDFSLTFLDLGDRSADFGLQGFHLIAEVSAVFVNDAWELLELRDHLLAEVVNLSLGAGNLPSATLDLRDAFLGGDVGYEPLGELLDASVCLVEVLSVREERLEAFLVHDNHRIIVKDTDGGSSFFGFLFHSFSCFVDKLF